MNKTMSASCSIEPDSLRSESCGLWSPLRCSTARESCESTITGTFSSLAKFTTAKTALPSVPEIFSRAKLTSAKTALANTPDIWSNALLKKAQNGLNSDPVLWSLGLIKKAQNLIKSRYRKDGHHSVVAAALLTKSGKVYTSLNAGTTQPSIATCAEIIAIGMANTDDPKMEIDMIDNDGSVAMLEAKRLGKIIVAHCEDESQATAGDSETAEIVRNIELAGQTGCKLHICHVSKKASIEAIRAGKAAGVDVSCETAPQYLILNNSVVEDDGCYKINPPIGNAEDQKALIEALKDGTLDMVITDHAPHSAEEKSRGYIFRSSGAVGLETSFPLMYTHFVKTGVISMERLLDLMVYNPRKRFGIPLSEDDYSLWDLEEEYEIDPEEFLSMGRSTPFKGMKVFGRCIKTVCGGKTAYERG